MDRSLHSNEEAGRVVRRGVHSDSVLTQLFPFEALRFSMGARLLVHTSKLPH